MKRKIFVFSVLLCRLLHSHPLDVKVSGKSAILINAETGAILYEKKADERAYPASLTKIATCLYAVKKNQNDLNAKVSAPPHLLRKMSKSVKLAHSYKDPAYLLEPDGTHYMIKSGEELEFIDLLYGLMLASGNDAANYLAHHVGGSVPKFMKGINDYLKQIGCKETHFSNPHGLHHPSHYTTARDIALITKEALQNELIRKIVSTKDHTRQQTNLQTPKMIQNKNQLIQPGKFFYPQAIGMKTGYHSDAGYTYAGAAKNEGRTLIAVVLGCDDYHECFRDAIRLFDAAFDEKKEERLLFRQAENTFSRNIKYVRETLQAILTEDISISYYPAEEPKITIELDWNHQMPPIEAGSFVGSINILDERGNILSSAPLVATHQVNRGFTAFLGDAIYGNAVCPEDLRKILTLFLAVGVGITLVWLWKVKDVKQTRKISKR